MCKEKERYLVIDPDGLHRWILADPDDLCTSFKKAIGCDLLKTVPIALSDLCYVVDAPGQAWDNPQPLNPFASHLLRGSSRGAFIYGPVIVARLNSFDGEFAWGPCTTPDLLKVASFLNIVLSAVAAEDK